MSLISRLIYARRGPFKRVAKELLALYGVEVPAAVSIGARLKIEHRGFGTVIHRETTIGDDVTIYHGVTIGRSDPWVGGAESRMVHINIGDGAVLCAGAVVVCKEGVLTVGARSIVGANSVLTNSIGPGEIWAGVPARYRGTRPGG